MTGFWLYFNLVSIVAGIIVVRLRPRCTRCHGRLWTRRLDAVILTAAGDKFAVFTCDVCALSGHPTNFLSKKGEEALRRDEEWVEGLQVRKP